MAYFSTFTTSPDGWDAAVETFNGAVVMAYQLGDVYGTEWMMFAGRPPGEIVNYPVMQNFTAINEADGLNTADGTGAGGDPATNIANDIVTVEIHVDKPLKQIKYIPRDQIEVRPDLRLPENFAVKLGRSIAEGKTQRIDSMIATAAYAAGNNAFDVTVGGSETRGDALKRVFNEIAAFFDRNGVPMTGRHIMLNSADWYELLGVPGMITREYGGQANVQRPGREIIYANWRIHNGLSKSWSHGTAANGEDWGSITNPGRESNTPGPTSTTDWYQADMVNDLGVAWHEEAWALRHWTAPTTDVDWVSQFNSYKVEARFTQGMRAIQDAGLAVLHLP
jgi:hypothetical protein